MNKRLIIFILEAGLVSKGQRVVLEVEASKAPYSDTYLHINGTSVTVMLGPTDVKRLILALTSTL